MRTPARAAVAAGLAALLAACAAQPPRKAPASVAIAAPAAPAPVAAPLPPPTPPADVWARLRSTFAMDDCGNAQAQHWARHFTRDPGRFSAQLQKALPLLTYVLNAAERAGVPGEFVLLPMVESGYNPAEPGRRGDPAGMWQIMPRTARTLGLMVSRDYDGRLDPAASTQVVLAMLKEYATDLHDWRLVDMAFNAGEYKITGLLGDRDAGSVDVHRLRVGSVTHDHLAKLLALACIVRDPHRFEVELPEASDATLLTLVRLPQAVELAAAARAADLPLSRLRALNPGYRSARMPEDAPHHLLLPQDNAQRLGEVLDAQGNADLADAESHMRNGVPPSSSRPASANGHPGHLRHRVRRGESPFAIARDDQVDPANLRAWNALAGDTPRPEQTLQPAAPD